MIRRDYKVKFYLDKLPAGYNLYPIKDKNNNPEILYSSGIPLGYMTTNIDGTENFYIYNHFTFNVKVHYEKNLDKYTIVGFDIVPISINHHIKGYMMNDGVIEDKPSNQAQDNSTGDKSSNESNIKDLETNKAQTNTSSVKGENRILSESANEQFLKSSEKENEAQEKNNTNDLNKSASNIDIEKNKPSTAQKSSQEDGNNKASNKELEIKKNEKEALQASNKGPKSSNNSANETEDKDLIKCADSKENYNLNFFDNEKQILRNKIIFTYDVVFELSDKSFTSRWDHYLHQDTDKIHWYNLINSSLIIFLISSVIVYIFMRSVNRGIEIYNTVNALFPNYILYI